jgi:hypothetical protein
MNCQADALALVTAVHYRDWQAANIVLDEINHRDAALTLAYWCADFVERDTRCDVTATLRHAGIADAIEDETQ